MTPLLNHSWVKSSYSNQDGGNCLEWSPRTAATTGVVPVRDSKAPEGPVLAFPATTFATFITSVKAGEFSA
ncbi:DUF397 domain-containing protein [Streptomyces sp. NPDC045369]|uniref:DUF397 domain-containing protein n=1 Tax=Streptomyces sp. NPDC045369 TaxID=3155732 RepID=UPI0033D1E905